MRTPALVLSLSVTLSAALSPTHGWSQPREVDTSPVTVSLGDALRRAASDPPSVLAALARVEASSLQTAVSRAAYLPTVNLSTSPSFSFSDRPTIAAGVGPARLQSAAVGIDATASARMTLYDFGRTASAVRAAEAGLEVSRADARTARLQSLSAAAVGYLTVLNDRENLASLDASIAQREARVRIAEGLVSAGTRPAIEALRARLDLESSRLERAAAEERAASNLAALASALGIDPLRAVRVLPIEDGALNAPLDPRDAADRAVAARPEFAAARLRVAQAEAQLSQVRAGRLPTLGASANLSASYAEVLTGNGLGGISESASAGLSLSWPLFDPTVRANIDVAIANVAVARRNLDAQTLSVRTAAVQAAVSARAAQNTLAQAERLAEVAAANLEQAAGRYAQGAAQLLELVDAQAADASARVAVLRARLSSLIAQAQLLAATGELEGMARP